jgi:hypothetical protein
MEQILKTICDVVTEKLKENVQEDYTEIEVMPTVTIIEV